MVTDTGGMDTEAFRDEQLQAVLARVCEVWPGRSAEERMYGSDDYLEGARPVDLVRLGRADEVRWPWRWIVPDAETMGTDGMSPQHARAVRAEKR